MDLIRKPNPELKPYIKKQRHPCPFYGFDGLFGMMIDEGGYQCGLKLIKQYTSCRMLLHKDCSPNWNKCSFNTEENKTKLVGILANMKIYPKEFEPPEKSDSKSWRGIDFSEWVDYVMGGE